MTQDQIIEMARQAQVHEELCGEHFIYEFAKLVAARTLMNIDPSKFMSYQEGIEAGRIAEREACLDVIKTHRIPVGNSAAGEMACEWTYEALKEIVAKIQARGEA